MTYENIAMNNIQLCRRIRILLIETGSRGPDHNSIILNFPYSRIRIFFIVESGFYGGSDPTFLQGRFRFFLYLDPDILQGRIRLFCRVGSGYFVGSDPAFLQGRIRFFCRVGSVFDVESDLAFLKGRIWLFCRVGSCFLESRCGFFWRFEPGSGL